MAVDFRASVERSRSLDSKVLRFPHVYSNVRILRYIQLLL